MLTLRRYVSHVEASLAKTLLEDYEVFCSFFDENVHCLGYYFAMPLRLMVADNQFYRAARILAYAESSPIPEDHLAADENAAAVILDETILGEDQQEGLDEQFESNNPWEILAIAYLFLIAGIGFLIERLPLVLWAGGRRPYKSIVLSPVEVHALGAALICVATFLTAGYFYTRRAIARDHELKA